MTTRTPTTCTCCQRPLTDLETFGSASSPMCREHHFSLTFDEGEPFDPLRIPWRELFAGDDKAPESWWVGYWDRSEE